MAASNSWFTVKQWPCSMYHDDKRKWIYGKLKIVSDGVLFCEEVTKKSSDNGICPYTLELKFGHFNEVKKTTTGVLFYGVILVIIKSGEKFWFSSLPDRDSIYAAIVHFWKCQLINTPEPPEKRHRISDDTSEQGRELLRMVYDSEQTLTAAASALSRQGNQLTGATGLMMDVHNDLDVADRVLTGIESWAGKWTSRTYKSDSLRIKPIIVENVDSLVYDCPCVAGLLTSIPVKCSYREGTLQVVQDGITIFDCQQAVIQHFKWTDISVVKVVHPWEMIITRYLIGQADLSYSVMSTRLVHALQRLEKHIASKMQYEDPPRVCSDRFDRTLSPESNGVMSMLWGDMAGRKASQIAKEALLSTNNQSASKASSMPTTSSASGSMQLQETATKHAVTDSEMEQLYGVLGKLKSLALDINNEHELQNEKLDILNDSVERANSRVKCTDNRVKRLL